METCLAITLNLDVKAHVQYLYGHNNNVAYCVHLCLMSNDVMLIYSFVVCPVLWESISTFVSGILHYYQNKLCKWATLSLYVVVTVLETGLKIFHL